MSHPRVFTQVFGVVGAILEREGKILLVKENKKATDPDNGKWNQPAGWIDVGEHPTDAVVREVKEETGYDFTPTHILGIYSLVREDIKGTLGEGSLPHPIKIIYVGTIGDTPSDLADDVSETRWFTPEEIEKMDISELRDVDIKDEVRDYFKGKKFPLDIITHTIQK